MPCVPSSVGWRASKTFMNFLLRLKNYFISNTYERKNLLRVKIIKNPETSEKNHYESFEDKPKESNKFIVYYKNNKYDITDFIPKHPGGSIINNAKNKNLDEVWDKYNVSLHKTNPKVQNILEKYKMN